MTFIIRGISTVMTVNVKVAYAPHEPPFSCRGGRVGEEGAVESRGVAVD
jgi:hypothetical protein